MALSQRLDLRQSQTLVMTPQLQQAIKLLQLSNLELSDFIDREIEQNPLLERAEESSAEGGDSFEPEAPEPAPESERPLRDTLDFTTSETLPGAGESPLDTDFENVWTNGSATDNTMGDGETLGQWSGSGGRSGFDESDLNLEQTLAGEISLRDHLLSQLNVDLTTPAERLIGTALIDLLDETGYLTADLADLAEQLGCPLAEIERVLAQLQRFDPPGIFARSLKECLAIQLRDLDRLDPAMAALLEHLDLLAARNMAALIKVCGVDAEDITDMLGEIRKLNPKPALAFDHGLAQPVTPDILMRAQSGGGWIVELNPDTLPRLLVNQRYFTKVSVELRSKAERDYLTERLNSANWLMKSLHQRATTILKVASELVRQQDAFFLHGVQHLKPLILRDIAEAIGMHESTVSRVTSNKFMVTPRGIFELKYFFTSSIQGADGGANHSAEAVRFRIKALVDEETAETVLSDDRIVEVLRDDGIDIARRTVAKYREAMRIPSSVQRRREKSLRF
ncbi:MAG: RNA polymerase factor sigma-54 [Rhodospirillaceae bacterium]